MKKILINTLTIIVITLGVCVILFLPGPVYELLYFIVGNDLLGLWYIESFPGQWFMGFGTILLIGILIFLTACLPIMIKEILFDNIKKFIKKKIG